MLVKMITPPAEEPVSLAEAKAFLRVDGTEDDTAIAALITAARTSAETFTRRSFVDTTLDAILDNSPAGAFTLPRGNVLEVVSVKTIAEDGATTTVDPDDYVADCNDPGRVVGRAAWPSHRGLASFVVRYKAGYGAAVDVPGPIRHAILMTVATLYENRSNLVVGTIVGELPGNATALLQPYRILRL